MSRNETEALIEENNLELEALRRDMAERQRRDKSAKTLAWCEARNQERAEAERAQAAEKRTATKPGVAMADSTQTWAQWVNGRIKQQIDSNQRAMEGAVADVVGSIAEKHKAALDDLRTEVTILRNEICQLRSEVKVRGALDDVQARLAKLETPPRLKAMVG